MSMKVICGCVRVGAAKSMFFREGYFVVFHGPGHCTCRFAGELGRSGLDSGNQTAFLGQSRAPEQET